MLKIAVWNPKGGVGKSTLALNLAGAVHHSLGRSVVVVDLDPQGSILEAAQEQRLPFPVLSTDTAGDLEGVSVYDYPPGYDLVPEFRDFRAVIFPMRPGRPDVKAGARIFADVQARAGRAIPVLSCADPRKRVQRAIFNVLRKSGLFRDLRVVRLRVAYERAWDQARTIFDPKFDNQGGVQEARSEILELLR